MSNDARFRCDAHLDRGHLQECIVTITRDAVPLFKVRAKRGREYILELATVCEMTAARSIKQDLQAEGRAVPQARRR